MFSQVDIPFEARPNLSTRKAASRRTSPATTALKDASICSCWTKWRRSCIAIAGVPQTISGAALRRQRLRRCRVPRPSGPGAAQPFTNNPRRLLAAFDCFTGGFPSEGVSTQAILGDDNTLSAAVLAAAAARRVENFKASQSAQAQIAGLDTMVGLESAVKMMAGFHGRRKALLLLSSGLPEAIFRALSYEGGAMNRAEAAAHARRRPPLVATSPSIRSHPPASRTECSMVTGRRRTRSDGPSTTVRATVA